VTLKRRKKNEEMKKNEEKMQKFRKIPLIVAMVIHPSDGVASVMKNFLFGR